MSIAKKFNLDIRLGKLFGWEWDDERVPFSKGPHWHLKCPPYVLYRSEY